MRDKKFKGKNKDTGEWMYGYYVLHCHTTVRNEIVFEHQIHTSDPKHGMTIITIVDPETVGQSAGLKDKKDKDIYEGDIVFSKRSNNKGEVFWHNDRGYWEVDCSITDKYIQPNDDWIDYEIIGNIHENSELLK